LLWDARLGCKADIGVDDPQAVALTGGVFSGHNDAGSSAAIVATRLLRKAIEFGIIHPSR